MVRRAIISDIPAILDLLGQVLAVHHNGRGDIFRESGSKYTADELENIINDDSTPVYVYDEGGTVKGYAFLIITETKDSTFLTDRRSVYIDDLCVDENYRHSGIGTKLYNYVVKYAEEKSFDSITLNVWNLNENAVKFYEKCGMKPLKVTMEKRL